MNTDVNRNKIDILGVEILNVSKTDAVDEIVRLVKSKSKKTVMFANANSVTIALRDKRYFEILRKTESIFGDGIGINIAARINGRTFVDNVNGTDLFPQLCGACEDEGFAVYFLGGDQQSLLSMVQKLKLQYPKLVVCGYHHGYFDHWGDVNNIIADINGSRAELLLLGMGTPLQEKWIDKYHAQINTSAALCVGGLFDFYSGKVKRAPKVMRIIGMEWLYRMCQEPRRLWRRYILGIPQFIFLVMKQKLSQ